jgi:hypothetical protein
MLPIASPHVVMKTFHLLIPLLSLPLLVLWLGPAAVGADRPQTANLLIDGDFDRADLRLVRKEEPGAWIAYGLTAPDVSVTVAPNAGRGDSHCLRYQRTQQSKASVHVDQLVPVKKNTIYELSAFVRWEGKLHPILSVTRMDWKPLTVTVCQAGSQWTEVRLVFNSFENERVRLEWYPGAEGKLYTAAAGISDLDDVCLRVMPNPSEKLRQAFELSRPKAAEEMPPAQRLVGPPARPTPLRPIVCREGVLRYEDGGEVALWGANVQTALSWEYNGRLKPAGVPLEAAALKQVTEQNLDQLELMGTQVIRAHLLPSDFADRDGNLVDTVFLDVLDHLVAQCRQRGIYIYLTLVNDMRTNYLRDSFMAGQERPRWLFDAPFVAHMEHYIQCLLNHRNRYTGQAYRDEPAIAVFEVMNEPGYLDYATLVGDPDCRPYREAFEAWCAANDVHEFRETHFRTYRYELVRRVVDRLAKAIRDTGSKKPVVWNLNWPWMINDCEDIFQAVADSSVDAVSFSCYPGQSDVPHLYWEHPKDLSGKNYLPTLREFYTNYQALRWMLSQRFAGKAKVTYEFESFFNQSTYMYPAMARLFRALGSQMAMMWQYTLSPVAQYCGGSHYLNLESSPPKALSYRIASHVFGELPRYTDYDTQAEAEMTFGHCTLSYPRNLSVFSSEQSLDYSRTIEGTVPAIHPHVREIAGSGRSPLVSYEGTGAYFVRLEDDHIDVQILPDVTYLRPLWQPAGRPPWTPTCQFDAQTPHRFALHLPGWEGPLRIERVNGGHAEAKRTEAKQTTDGACEITPGRYRISHASP